MSTAKKPAPEAEKVAVIGAGIAGLSAAYLLARQGKKVTLFESEERCGGHALTVDTPEGPVDLGFQVCNLTTYPHLMGFFRALGVDTECSDMSFALSTPGVEWGSRSLSAIFAQPGSTRSPRFLRMIYEVTAFGRQAPEVLRDASWAEKRTTLGEYLKIRRYSAFFVKNYIAPMCAAIWSCSEADALDFPVVSMVRFWINHHLLDIVERPVWRVVKGRSQAYVAAAVAQIEAMGGEVRTGARVEGIERDTPSKGKVAVKLAGAAKPKIHFDHVVLATHADVTRAILGDGATADEAAALEAIRYQNNDVYLHSDAALMPRRREVWASWNCVQPHDAKEAPAAAAGGGGGGDGLGTSAVCVSYWVNLLQNLREGAPDLFVTLNPHTPPDPATVLLRTSLAHPLFNQAAIEAQARLSTGALQGVGGVWFCGAWCGYGFHEDGIRSAVHMAQRLCGGENKGAASIVPWEPVACAAKLPLSSRPWLELFRRFGGAMLPTGAAVRLVLPNGAEQVLGDVAAAAAAAAGDEEAAEGVATLYVRDTALFQKVVLRSDIGLGEAYMDGLFTTPDLLGFVSLLSRAACAADAKAATSSALGPLAAMAHALGERLELAKHQRNSNTKEGSAANIAYHYDAGNDFYKLFLDSSMMYSSGIHKGLYAGIEGLSFAQQEAALEEAQLAKLDAMIARAELKPGERVLEIGCGWGFFAMRMAKMVPGVHVTGITVSKEQLAEARQRVRDAGLEAQISIEFCDYRDVQGTYDKVVSIEMLEAVGHEHLPSFFGVVSRALKPGGLAAIQVITLPDARYDAYCNSHSDFIRTYIFPGGHCPSLGEMVGVGSRLGLELQGCMDIGDDYAVTLRLWRERMMARADEVRALGYPERFLRMYEFYFVYCEAGFANGLIHDYQLAWRKTAAPPPPLPALGAGPTADGGIGGLDQPSAADAAAGTDPLTRALLLVWCGLLLRLCVDKPLMATIPAAVLLTIGVRVALRPLLRRLDGKRPAASSSSSSSSSSSTTTAATAKEARARPAASFAEPLTALATEVIAAAASAALLAAAFASLPAPSAGSFARLLLDPTTPAALAAPAQALVGTAAGFSALRVWELARTPRRGYGAVATYAVALSCQTAALFYGKFMLAVAAAQLAAAHSAALRLRALQLLRQKPPGSALWLGAWGAFWAARALPHTALLLLFALSGPPLPAAGPATAHLNAWRMATAGLAFLTAYNLAIGAQMWKARVADAAAASIANVQHRKGDADAEATAADAGKPGAQGFGTLAVLVGVAAAVAQSAAARQALEAKAASLLGLGGVTPVELGLATLALLAVGAMATRTPAPRLAVDPLTAPLAACALAGTVALTLFVQEAPCARLVLCTTAAYATLYALMRHAGVMQPPPGTLGALEAAQWRSRALSTINGVVVAAGALLCFSEWPYAGAEGWISQHIWSHPVTFASLFVGYLQWDLAWCVWHVRTSKDYESLVHHTLFVAITHYVLWGWYFKVPFAWLSLAELSTPFLNLRWFLAVLGRKDGRAYLAASLAFASTFLLTRVLGYVLGIAHLWWQRELWLPAQRGLYAVIGGCHLGLALNLYWSTSVVGALFRLRSRGAARD